MEPHWINLQPGGQASKNINVLELLSIWLACILWGSGWKDRQVICWSDKTQVVASINKGSSCNLINMSLLRSIFWYSVRHNFHLVASSEGTSQESRIMYPISYLGSNVTSRWQSYVNMFLVISGDLDNLDSLVFNNIPSAWSVNTIAMRSSQWKRFFSFCMLHGLVPLPASSRTVARFVSELALSCKYSTVVNYLSSITTMHKFYGLEPEFRESYYLTMVVQGIKIRLGSGVRQKIGLTPKQLLDMYLFVSLGNQVERVCWAAIIFSFRTLLRKSHVLPDSTSYTPHLITRKDIEFFPNGMLVYVTTSKSDRSGNKPQKITIYQTDQRPLCAFSWTKNHFLSTPTPETGLFLKEVNGKYVPLMYNGVLQYLQRLVGFIGLDPHDAGLHSLRRSGASYLNSIGVSLPEIKLIGNWRSSAVFEYIRSSDDRLSSIQRTVAESLNYV